MMTAVKRMLSRATPLLVGALFAAGVHAADAPSVSANTNYFEGVIGWVDVNQRAIVIDDTAFRLSDTAARYPNLREGVNVKVQYRSQNGHLTILRVMP